MGFSKECFKNDNDSNEVAITYSMDSIQLIESGKAYMGVALGTEHDVDPFSNTMAYHLVSSAKECVVIVLHNHPSLSHFSLSDIQFLLQYEALKMLVAVTNLGNVSYIVKTQKYNFKKAVAFFNEAVDRNNGAKSLKDLQDAADYFLKNCYNIGIEYENR